LNRYHIIIILLLTATQLAAQNIDLQNVVNNAKQKVKTKNPVTIAGNINATASMAQSTAGGLRDPYNYFINGGLSISAYGVSIPLNFTLTNAGFSYSYQFPRLPNRLSIHPKYKWIQAHAGDFSMAFSPYSINGFQMTGAGVELRPANKPAITAFYARLQKAVPYLPGNGNTIAAYKRKGYGVKTEYDKGQYKFAASYFYAADDANSLQVQPDSARIFPQENHVLTGEINMPLLNKMKLTTEYGLSILTTDVRAGVYSGSDAPLPVKLFGNKISTVYAQALKTNLSYTIGSSTIGFGFEHVDPGYSTLGSYYFNNDLENFTFNFSQAILKGKVTITGNGGLQKNDLDKKKSGGSNRTVGSLSVAMNINKRCVTNMTYSNFQTFTNVKPQFQLINQLTPYDNLDTLNFRQLSQNANINFNYVVNNGKVKPQNLNINLSFQDAFDEQGGIVSKGNASQLWNMAAGYSFNSVPKKYNISAALNATYNTIGKNNSVTIGPTVSYNKKLFNNKMSAGGSLSFNQSMAGGKNQQQVLAARMNAAYVLKKKHNIGLNGTGMIRKAQNGQRAKDLNVSLTYGYSFSIL
jgi:hypothetical protein